MKKHKIIIVIIAVFLGIINDLLITQVSFNSTEQKPQILSCTGIEFSSDPRATVNITAGWPLKSKMMKSYNACGFEDLSGVSPAYKYKLWVLSTWQGWVDTALYVSIWYLLFSVIYKRYANTRH